jgi:hypothetical protein
VSSHDVDHFLTDDGARIRARLLADAADRFDHAIAFDGPAPGSYVGHRAIEALERCAGVATELLDTYLRPLDPDLTVNQLAWNLELHDRGTFELHRRGDDSDHLRLESSAIRSLLEHVLSDPGKGRNDASAEECVVLTQLAMRLDSIRGYLQRADPNAARLNRDPTPTPASRALTTLEATIEPSGVLHIKQLPLRFDFELFNRLLERAGVIAHDPSLVDQLLWQGSAPAPMSAEIAALNQEFAAGVGCSLRSWFGTLQVLSTDAMSGPMTENQLTKFIFERARGKLPEHEVRAAVKWTTLRAGEARSKLAEPPDQSAPRRMDLSLRPIVELPRSKKLIWYRHTVGVAADLTLSYLSQWTLGWRRQELPWSVGSITRTAAQAAQTAFEDDVAATVQSAGWWTHCRLDPKTVERLALPLRGEIDLLAAHPDSSILWVLEAKDSADKYSVEQISVMLDQYFDLPPKAGGGQRSQHQKLLGKVLDVEVDPRRLVSSLGGPDRDWSVVRCAFVSRRPLPAACAVPPPKTPFVMLADLVEFLERESIAAG